jgi:hypothetical protein
MTPYRLTRDWLGDFRRGGRARTPKEKFNHSHSILRNVIERTFGVLKARFPILKKMPPFDFPTQRNIVVACMTIHNFLRRVTLNDPLFIEYEAPGLQLNNEVPMDAEDNPNQEIFRPEDQTFMINYREQITTELTNGAYEEDDDD